MRAPLRTLPLILLACLAGFADAQERPETPLARVAREAGAQDWPAPSPARAGVEAARLKAPGWTIRERRVDPRRAEAALQLVAGESAAPGAQVMLRVHPAAAAARKELLARLLGVQARSRLQREEALGDVAFAGRAADGRLELLYGVLGNVAYEVRSLSGADVTTLAAALVALVRAAPAAEGRLPAPRLVGLEVEPARVGRPARLQLDFDPGAPSPEHVIITASGGAAVVETDAGYELYASRPGRVTLTIHACSSGLLASRATREVEVAAGDD